MSHVPYMNESQKRNTREVDSCLLHSCATYEWVMSHISMSHFPLINEFCHTYAWVMSHGSTSHVTHMNETFHTYEWVIAHISIESCPTTQRESTPACGTHVLRMNEPCHTDQWVMAHISMGHVPQHRGSRHLLVVLMTYELICHVTHKNKSCPTYK